MRVVLYCGMLSIVTTMAIIQKLKNFKINLRVSQADLIGSNKFAFIRGAK